MTCQTSSLEPALPEQPEPAQCHKWPRLPRKTKVAVSKCHAGHAKVMDEPAEKQGWMNQSQSESLLAQGKSAQLSWTKRSTAMPVLCSRARNGTCAQGKCSWCHKAASSIPVSQDNVFWDIGQLMGTWHSHTGRIELKERWRKTFRTVWNDKFRCSIWQRETARNMNWFQARHSHTAQICTGLFCQRQGYLRRTWFLPTLSQNPVVDSRYVWMTDA